MNELLNSCGVGRLGWFAWPLQEAAFVDALVSHIVGIGRGDKACV